MFRVTTDPDNPAKWVVAWPDKEDIDGTPIIGCVWDNGTAVPISFPRRKDADKFCGWLNKGYAIET